MRIVFGSHPFEPRRPDPAFTGEFEAALAAGMVADVVSFESLFEEHNADGATRWITAPEDAEVVIYRGFMLTQDNYALLYGALRQVNLQLINTPEEYGFCHYLPGWYESLRGHTPETRWFECTADDCLGRLHELLSAFGTSAVVVKDFVKSEKSYWHEACFIPDASDYEAAERVVSRFLELRGPALNKGIVLRRYVPLAPADLQPAQGQPGSVEVRYFVLRGPVLACAAHGAEGTDLPTQAEIQDLLGLLPHIGSNFFTMDLALTAEGQWIVMELGDGQVSGLPEGLTSEQFYRALSSAPPETKGNSTA
jgi:hypothetical protein